MHNSAFLTVLKIYEGFFRAFWGFRREFSRWNFWVNILQIGGKWKYFNLPQWCSGSIRPSGGFDPGSIPGWGDFY